MTPIDPDEAAESGEAPAARRLPATVVALGWVSFLTDVASEMIYPLLPDYLTRVLRANKATIGLIEGVAETTAALLRLPSGVLSDRSGRRKPLILLGYGVAGLVRPLIGLAQNAGTVLGIRFFDRLGKGIRGAPRDAMLADSTVPEQRGRAFGFHRAMDHAGAALGPVLAFAWLAWRPGDVRTLFLLAFVPGIAVLLVLVFGLREPARPAGQTSPGGEKPVPRKFQWNLSSFDKRFPWFLAALLIFVLGNSSDMFLLLRMSELGLETKYVPLLWCAFHLAKSGMNLVGGRLADRYEPRLLLLAGWLLYALVYVGFGLASHWWQALLLFMAYAVFYGLTEPAEKGLVARWSPAGSRGAGFGWFNLVLGIGALPASLVFGFLWDHPRIGSPGAFVCGAALALAACAVLAMTFLQRDEVSVRR
ncbi:MAG: MFS transporter [Pirellulales bacterium]